MCKAFKRRRRCPLRPPETAGSLEPSTAVAGTSATVMGSLVARNTPDWVTGCTGPAALLRCSRRRRRFLHRGWVTGCTGPAALLRCSRRRKRKRLLHRYILGITALARSVVSDDDDDAAVGCVTALGSNSVRVPAEPWYGPALAAGLGPWRGLSGRSAAINYNTQSHNYGHRLTHDYPRHPPPAAPAAALAAPAAPAPALSVHPCMPDRLRSCCLWAAGSGSPHGKSAP